MLDRKEEWGKRLDLSSWAESVAFPVASTDVASLNCLPPRLAGVLRPRPRPGATHCVF